MARTPGCPDSELTCRSCGADTGGDVPAHLCEGCQYTVCVPCWPDPSVALRCPNCVASLAVSRGSIGPRRLTSSPSIRSPCGSAATSRGNFEMGAQTPSSSVQSPRDGTTTTHWGMGMIVPPAVTLQLAGGTSIRIVPNMPVCAADFAATTPLGRARLALNSTLPSMVQPCRSFLRCPHSGRSVVHVAPGVEGGMVEGLTMGFLVRGQALEGTVGG